MVEKITKYKLKISQTMAANALLHKEHVDDQLMYMY